MKIRSRKRHIDPLHEGTKFLAYTHSEVMEEHFTRAIPGSLKLAVTVQAGQVMTEVSYIDHDGNTYQQMNVESVCDLMDED